MPLIRAPADIRVIHKRRKSLLRVLRSLYAKQRARSTVSLACLSVRLRPPTYPFAAFMILLRRARLAGAHRALGIIDSLILATNPGTTSSDPLKTISATHIYCCVGSVRLTISCYPYGRSLLICAASFGSMKASCLKFLLRLVALLVRMWLWKALFLLIFPLLSTVNLFAAPRHVFIFGISILPHEVLGRTVTSAKDY